MNPWGRTNARQMRIDLLRQIATGLWWTTGLIGWAILMAEAARLALDWWGRAP